MIFLLFLILQPIWVQLGTYDGFTYEAIAISNKKTAKTKNVSLRKDSYGWYLVKDWDIDCKENTIRNTNTQIYNPADELMREVKEYGAVLKVEKGSFADKALDIWCE